MRILKRSTVVAYANGHAPARAALLLWLEKTQAAKWKQSNDVLSEFKSVKVLNAERVRFEIGSNYRLIAAIDYPREVVYIKFIGTHANTTG